jgi:hypothetical protein
MLGTGDRDDEVGGGMDSWAQSGGGVHGSQNKKQTAPFLFSDTGPADTFLSPLTTNMIVVIIAFVLVICKPANTKRLDHNMVEMGESSCYICWNFILNQSKCFCQSSSVNVYTRKVM